MKNTFKQIQRYASETSKEKRIMIAFLAIFFSICTLLGRSYEKYGTWDNFFELACIPKLIALSITYAVVIFVIYVFMDRSTSKKQMDIVIKNEMIIYTFVILICWLPYLICFFPGSIQTDASHQILEGLGSLPLVDHQPVFSSLLMGGFAKAGIYLGNINMGIFLYVLLQTILSALCYAYMITTMHRYKAPMSLCIISLIYFALVPFWGGYAQTMVKDTLFTAVSTLFVVILFINVHQWEIFISNRNRMFAFVLLMFVMALLRKNGIYTAVLTMCVLLITFRKNWIKICCMLLALCCLYTGYTKLMLPGIGAEEGSIREALSIPFQQTARYLREYPEDLTAQERRRIGRVLQVNELAELYKPNISDPVKNTFHEAASKEELQEYFSIWWKLLWRHPDVYIQATLNNTYGYFYPGALVMGGYGTFDMELDDELHSMGVRYGSSKLSEGRKILVKIVYKIGNLPILHWIYSAGIYTWILLLTAGYMIANRNYRNMTVLVPSITILLVCIASPVNNYMRYALPMMASTPIVFFVSICNDEWEEIAEKGVKRKNSEKAN